MKISVEEFMRQEQGIGKKSRLDPYENDILTLKSNGYSYEQIIKFLSQNDIEISKTALHHFVKSRSAGKKSAAARPVSPIKKQSTSVDKPSGQSATATRPAPSEKPSEPEKTERPIIGKFDMQREINSDELY